MNYIFMATAVGAVIGIIVWIVLLVTDKLSDSFRQYVLIIFIVGLLCRIGFAIYTPTFYAPDEQSHFKYIQYLYENKSFPVQTSKTDAITNDWEYYQPPLYYLTVTPTYWATYSFLGQDVSLLVRSIRVFSIFLWIINIIFAFKILDNLQVTDIFIYSFTISMICLIPTYTSLSSAINNDNLLITIGAGLLYLLSKQRTFFYSLCVGILLGIALLTKLTAVIYAFAVFAIVLVQWLRKSISIVEALAHFSLIVTIAMLLWLPWGIRNLLIYGDLTAESVANVPREWPSLWHGLLDSLHYIEESFWAVSGIYNNIRFVPTVGRLVTYLALAGLVYGLLQGKRQMYDFFTGPRGDFMAAMLLAIIVNIALVLRFGVLYGQAQGRFLFPLLIPIACLMAVSFAMLEADRYLPKAHVHVGGLFAVYALSFFAYSMANFP